MRTAEQLVAHARELKAKHGFTSHKLKGGVFPPDYELECYRALGRARSRATRFRFDPNGVWSVEQAIRFGQAIEDLNNDYFEDPACGLNGMRRVREMVRIPLATNTVVVNFEQLAANVLDTAVDVILLDTTFWGGIRQCVKAAGVCETFQLGVAVHSSGELGIQLATMLHLGAVSPTSPSPPTRTTTTSPTTSSRAGRCSTRTARSRCRPAPGLGVKLDREKLGKYAELYRARRLSLRPGSRPAGLVPARPQHQFRRPSRRRRARSRAGVIF